MKIQIIFRGFLLLLIFASTCLGQDEDVRFYRQKLNELIKQRKDRFQDFTESVEKKTGIFGIQSKRDLKRTTEVLSEIVVLDNEIIRNLEKIGEQQTFNKAVQQIDSRSFDQRIKNDSIRIARLTADKEKHSQVASEQYLTLAKYKIYIAGLFLLAGIFFLLWISDRRKFRKQARKS